MDEQPPADRRVVPALGRRAREEVCKQVVEHPKVTHSLTVVLHLAADARGSVAASYSRKNDLHLERVSYIRTREWCIITHTDRNGRGNGC